MEARIGNAEQSRDWIALVFAGAINGRKKSFFLTAALISVALFGMLFYFLCRYQSDGFLRANRSLTEFNAERPAFEDRANLLRYLQANKLAGDPNAQYLLQALDPGLIQKQVKPVLPYSKEDLMFLSGAKTPVDANLLGFNISFTAVTPDEAAARVKLMGEYLRDSMLRQDLLENIHARAGEAKAEKQKLDNKLIAKRLELEEATNKLSALKTISAKYPEASKFESRQLLTSDVDSSKYLSPVMQLVGVESNIADLRIEIASLERDVAQNALRLEFYSRVDKLNSSATTGKDMLDAFKRQQAETFKSANLNDDQVREVVNRISLLAENLETKHLVDTRFVSGPTLPARRSGPRRGLLAVLALFGGAILAASAMALLTLVRRGKTTSIFEVRGQVGNTV